MKKETTSIKDFFNKNRFFVIGTLISVVVVLLIFTVTSERQAVIEITVPEKGTTVLIDNNIYATSKTNQETIRAEVQAGRHEVMLARNNDWWPWYKNVTVNAGEVRTLTPFLIKKDLIASEISSLTPNYKEIVDHITIPTEKAYSRKRTVRAEIKDNRIKATWLDEENDPLKAFCLDGSCQDTITVVSSGSPIDDVEFYPLRNDVILFSSGGSVSAIELDREDTQNFQPLYTGTKPLIHPLKNQIFIYDEGTLYLLK